MNRRYRSALLLIPALASGWFLACASSPGTGAPTGASGSSSSGTPDPGDAAPPDEDGGARIVQVFQTSRAGDKLTDKGKLSVHPSSGASTRSVVALAPTVVKQAILGFGGALTESSAVTLAALPADKRKSVIDAYFSSTGAGYTLARTHIASSDFSVMSYQYSLVSDPKLGDFTIDHDKTTLIPLLKDAVASSGGALKIVAAPWSAPAWMKSPPELFVKPSAANNYSGQDPILDPKNYAVYALYLSKYLQAYKAEGVSIWGLSPQNEPLGNGGNWETMRWDPVSMKTFIRDDLGPQLEADGLDTKILIYDHNKGPVDSDLVKWSKVILSDPASAKYVYGTATHWYGSTINVYEDSLDAVHAVDPSKPILFTEGTIDGLTDQKAAPASAAYAGSWMKDEFYWTKDEYDWGYWWSPDKAIHPAYEPVYRYARDIIVGLNHWYAGWIDWNAVLDSTGGPNHEGNVCAAPVMVDAASQTIYYSPLFYVMSHFSKFIRPDAHVIGSTVTLAPSASLAGYDGKPTDGLLATASKNADGSIAVVLFNETGAPMDYEVTLDGKSAEGSIAAQALQTLVWPAAL